MTDTPLRPRLKHLSVFALLIAAVGAGFLISRPSSAFLHARVDPHRWLQENASERVYVTSGCSFSDSSIEHLDSSPAGERFVVVPLDSTPGPERDQWCRQALERIEDEGAPWWLMLPDSYLCDRLVASARDYATEATSASATARWSTTCPRTPHGSTR